MSAEAIKLARKAARKIVDESGYDGIDLDAVAAEVLREYPDAGQELAVQSFTTWLGHALASARTDDNTPAYSTTGQRTWKQTELFTVEESACAIARRITGLTRDLEMVRRMADRHRRMFGRPVEVPQLLWQDGDAAVSQ
jgi:hypothetical protein